MRMDRYNKARHIYFSRITSAPCLATPSITTTFPSNTVLPSLMYLCLAENQKYAPGNITVAPTIKIDQFIQEMFGMVIGTY